MPLVALCLVCALHEPPTRSVPPPCAEASWDTLSTYGGTAHWIAPSCSRATGHAVVGIILYGMGRRARLVVRGVKV